MKCSVMILTLAATMALASAVHADAFKLPDNGVTRTVDCGGRDLIVTGDGDTLAVSGCAVINVVGNHNKMQIQLLPGSSIAALGDDNHIVFLHAPGIEVQVSSTGKGNEVIPDMSRDRGDISPVKFPLHPKS